MSEFKWRHYHEGVGIKSLNDPIDTTSPQGRLVFNIFASLAEFERNLINERTQAGLKRGRTGGRPKGQSDEAKLEAIAENLGISKATLYSDLRHRGIKFGT